jgi:hypothetical protein
MPPTLGSGRQRCRLSELADSVLLGGAELDADDEANHRLYGENCTAKEIVLGNSGALVTIASDELPDRHWPLRRNDTSSENCPWGAVSLTPGFRKPNELSLMTVDVAAALL